MTTATTAAATDYYYYYLLRTTTTRTTTTRTTTTTTRRTTTTTTRTNTTTSRAARGGGGSFKNIKPIGKIRCCESRNVFVGGNSKTAAAVKNLDAIAKCEAHDYCFANCFQTCQKGPFSVDFTVCSNLGI